MFIIFMEFCLSYGAAEETPSYMQHLCTFRWAKKQNGVLIIGMTENHSLDSSRPAME